MKLVNLFHYFLSKRIKDACYHLGKEFLFELQLYYVKGAWIGESWNLFSVGGEHYIYKIKCTIAEFSTNDQNNLDYKQKGSWEGSLCWEMMKRMRNVLVAATTAPLSWALCVPGKASFALSFLTGKMRRWSHDHLSLEQCTASSALLLVTTPSHSSSRVLKKCVFILNNKHMEVAHLRQDCASCSQNLGRKESPFSLRPLKLLYLSHPPVARCKLPTTAVIVLDTWFLLIRPLYFLSQPPALHESDPSPVPSNTPILPSAILSLWILSGLGLQFPALFLDLYFQSFLPVSSHLSLLDTVSNVLDQEVLSIRPPEPP